MRSGTDPINTPEHPLDRIRRGSQSVWTRRIAVLVLIFGGALLFSFDRDVVAIASLVLTGAALWYARDAAIIGRKALLLAEQQAAHQPIITVTFEDGEEHLVLQRPQTVQRDRRSQPWTLQRSRTPVDIHVSITVTNAGTAAAHGIHGWIEIDSAILQVLDADPIIAAVPRSWGWFIDYRAPDLDDRDDDIPDEIQIYADKLTPGTSRTFSFPVHLRAVGSAKVSYHVVSDEGIDTDGELLVHIEE